MFETNEIRNILNAFESLEISDVFVILIVGKG